MVTTFLFITTNFFFNPPNVYAFWDLVGYVSGEVLIGLIAAVLLSRYFTKHLRELAAVSAVISHGDLTHKVDVRTGDEVGEVARSFNTMLQSLYNIVTEVRSVSEQIFESAQSLSATAQEMNAEEHTSELQSPYDLVCRLLLEKITDHTSPSTSSRRLQRACRRRP